MLLDLTMLCVGWALIVVRTIDFAYPSTFGPSNVGWTVAAVLCNGLLIAAHNLYLARVCSVRAVELQGLGRSVIGTALTIVAVEQLLRTELPLREVWLAGSVVFALLAAGRLAYASWLRQQRTAGRFVRELVFVGADGDAVELAAVMREHPEFGFQACGYVGRAGYSNLIGVPHLGPVERTLEIVDRVGASGVVIIASAIESEALNDVVRQLLAAHVHVQLSSGLRGIAQQRFRATPLAYEPLFYVEPASLTPLQTACKRAIDVAGAAIGLVLAAPLLAMAMVAIRIDSRGPVLFRQQRVGRDGTTFEFLKLRTMVVDAEAERTKLEHRNQRASGPLFKAADDPRITRVGRFLRASSIDELPQLWHVLRGSMSLVGPRPALPTEVEQFDARLQTRTQVSPGLTGLWQIEARDNPEFGPYRRLDLFYVENWSPLLDVGILITTVLRVLGRALKLGRKQADADGDADHQIVLD